MFMIYFRTVLPKTSPSGFQRTVLCLIQPSFGTKTQATVILSLHVLFIYPQVSSSRVSACLSTKYFLQELRHDIFCPEVKYFKKWINKIRSAWRLSTNWDKIVQLLICLPSYLTFQDWQKIFGLSRWIWPCTLYWSLFLEFLEFILNTGKKP